MNRIESDFLEPVLVINKWFEDVPIERLKVSSVVVDYIDFSGLTIEQAINQLKIYQKEVGEDAMFHNDFDWNDDVYYKLVILQDENDYEYTKRCNNLNARQQNEMKDLERLSAKYNK